MKIHSLSYLIQTAKRSLVRFPLSILSSFISVCIGVYLAECHREIVNIFPYINLMLCTTLGIALFFCVDVITSNGVYSKRAKLSLKLTAIGILSLLYFSFPGSDSTLNTTLPYIRYGIYSITIHLIVAFVPFLKGGKLNGFWHYNKILFVRFLTSLLYSAFLYGGLALALGSLDFLFDVDLHEELFFDLFIIIGGFFNTWFFVSGIPEKFDGLEEIKEYPKGIKIFSQFILLPLLILYLLILYGYAGKIILFWNWPKGIVSYLVACVAVLGILTLLLIHPYGSLKENSWIKKFSRVYYFILFPLVALLFVAIGMRISDYGITINRYVIVLLGIWLTVVCTYFSIGKTNIKFVPISLAIILILMSFGYWGMFSVSERSQVNRLKEILMNSKILSSGQIKNEVTWVKDSLPLLYALQGEGINENKLEDSLHNEVKSILDYLDAHHGFSAIKDWYSQDLDSGNRLPYKNGENWRRVDEAETYMRSLALSYEYKYKNARVSESFNFYTAGNYGKIIPVQGYDYVIDINHYDYEYNNNKQDSFDINGTYYAILYDLKVYQIFFMNNRDTIQFDLKETVHKLVATYSKKQNEYSIPNKEMALVDSGKDLEAKLQINELGFDKNSDSVDINSLRGDLLIRLKK